MNSNQYSEAACTIILRTPHHTSCPSTSRLESPPHASAGKRGEVTFIMFIVIGWLNKSSCGIINTVLISKVTTFQPYTQVDRTIGTPLLIVSMNRWTVIKPYTSAETHPYLLSVNSIGSKPYSSYTSVNTPSINCNIHIEKSLNEKNVLLPEPWGCGSASTRITSSWSSGYAGSLSLGHSQFWRFTPYRCQNLTVRGWMDVTLNDKKDNFFIKIWYIIFCLHTWEWQ